MTQVCANTMASVFSEEETHRGSCGKVHHKDRGMAWNHAGSYNPDKECLDPQILEGAMGNCSLLEKSGCQ